MFRAAYRSSSGALTVFVASGLHTRVVTARSQVWVGTPIVACFIVKCTLVQALRLCTGGTAHRGSRGIVLPFFVHGTRRGSGVNITPWPLFTPGKDPVPIVQEAGWAPEPAWTGAENLDPTGIRSPDRPARSQSLYRLSYPGPRCVFYTLHKILIYSRQTKEDEIFGTCSMNGNFDKNIEEIETAWETQTQIEYSKMASQYIRCDWTWFDCWHVNEPYQFLRDF